MASLKKLHLLCLSLSARVLTLYCFLFIATSNIQEENFLKKNESREMQWACKLIRKDKQNAHAKTVAKCLAKAYQIPSQ